VTRSFNDCSTGVWEAIIRKPFPFTASVSNFAVSAGANPAPALALLCSSQLELFRLVVF
jgi:hypothetical protein